MGWRQGEHVTLIGPTGRGKTELTIELLELRSSVVFFGTKRRDVTQDALRADGYMTITNADGLNPQVSHHFILRPPFPQRMGAAELKAFHRDVFREGIMRAFRQTGWTIALDEAKYICHFLGLGEEAAMVWLQGRSQGNSVVAAVQRPRFIPLEAYDQATHLFMWTDSDHANVKRNCELAGANAQAVLEAFAVMEMHDVLYLNTVTSEMFITNTRWE